MATIGTQNLTLLDLQKRMDPNGNVAQIIEQLDQSTEIIQDMTMVECNQGSSFVTTVRNGLPSVTWRKLYGGVQASKSATSQITDTCGMLEAYSQTDKAIVDKSKDKASFRASEDKAFIQSMGQEYAVRFSMVMKILQRNSLAWLLDLTRLTLRKQQVQKIFLMQVVQAT